jgi:hypothetical protein
VTPLPCETEADRFTSPHPTESAVNYLASTYCDSCPVRPGCYSEAVGDNSTWGVYGGVWFVRGRPIPARQVALFAKRIDIAHDTAAHIDAVLGRAA